MTRENSTEIKSRKKITITMVHFKQFNLINSYNQLQNENWFVPVKLSSSESFYSPNDVIC